MRAIRTPNTFEMFEPAKDAEVALDQIRYLLTHHLDCEIKTWCPECDRWRRLCDVLIGERFHEAKFPRKKRTQ